MFSSVQPDDIYDKVIPYVDVTQVIMLNLLPQVGPAFDHPLNPHVMLRLPLVSSVFALLSNVIVLPRVVVVPEIICALL